MHPNQKVLLACFYACVLILTLTMAQTNANTTYTITKGANVTKPGCTNQCGNVTVPYPFGIGSGCAFDSGFEIHCNNSEKPLTEINLTVYDISDAELRISNVFGWRCYNSTGAVISEDMVSKKNLESSPYSFSALNRFIVVGCDDYGAIAGPNNFEYGCSVSCTSRDDVMKGGECMGKGCCQKQIPKGLKYYSTTMSSTGNHTDVWSFNSCGYAFLGEADRFHFQGLPDLGDDLHVNYFYQSLKATVPIVLEWAIGNLSCAQALERLDDYACRENSHCVDSDTGLGGYRCSCNTGYHGNPYLNQGCQGIGIGFISLVVGISWLYFSIKKRKLIKVREKFFQQNGGLLLKQRISTKEGGVEATRIFTLEELKKATNNYANDRILGRGGNGIVYRGVLRDTRIVAIKKSRIVDENQIEQFINEMKFLQLVYEYVSEGNLYEHIHNQREGSWLTWQNRFRIAAEIVTTFAYLHSFASMPIIHRDVKSANILLDNAYTAKVADFGASKLITLDQTQVATLVLGTSGYLDPEYFQTSQLTEKSDVYSFGVVLAELLTGLKPIIRERNDEQKNLADYFVSSVNNNHLFQILDHPVLQEGNLEQLQKKAELVKNCLKLHREDRPTMKEVAIELEAGSYGGKEVVHSVLLVIRIERQHKIHAIGNGVVETCNEVCMTYVEPVLCHDISSSNGRYSIVYL
ncbi:hypothetical protein H5410_052932 [Solanum commersonii]|uniref:Protein kinase domain-containing protein n=1 Tax=Solanum commersonii TaxID=4109 RepID=A0A9J5X257_SOLCO|nr:hypothetical protein H5410_052932 [Solanum commersonii]